MVKRCVGRPSASSRSTPTRRTSPLPQRRPCGAPAGPAAGGSAGAGAVVYRVEALPLLPGSYTLSAAVYDERELHPFDHHHQVYPFQVVSADGVERYGLIELAGEWSYQPAANRQPSTIG